MCLTLAKGAADDAIDATDAAEPAELGPLPSFPAVPSSDPDFEEETANNVRVAVGTTAYLTCRPRSLRNKTVISRTV